jgi:chemotaxis signal transduction protein
MVARYKFVITNVKTEIIYREKNMDAITEKKGKPAIEVKFLAFVLGNEIYGIEILKA